MQNIKKTLTNYVHGKGPKVKNNTIQTCAEKDANKTADILLKIINDEIDKIDGTESLDKVRELINLIETLLSTSEDINRKIIMRRLHKLDEKIDRIKEENNKKILNSKKAYKELETTRKALEKIQETTYDKESQQYYFMNYLVEEIKEIDYIEYAFGKMPTLINVKDKEGVSLFRNITKKYTNSIKEKEEEEITYYRSLLSLILLQKNFELNEKEKKDTLNEIYKTLDQISISKKDVKENKEKITELKTLMNTIKDKSTRGKDIEESAKIYGIPVYFNEDIMDLVNLSNESSLGQIQNRKKLKEYMITIDKETAIELDDALSCKKLKNGNYLLGVHTASPLGYFPYESSIIQEAISRIHAIYLPYRYQTKDNNYSKMIPIFPYEFSVEQASLLPNGDKLARSYLFEIDKNGEIVKEKFLKTIIQIDKKMNYKEVEDILKNGTENQELGNTIRDLKEVTNILERRYKKHREYDSLLEDEKEFEKGTKTESKKMVYLPMILTGNRVAEFFAHPQRNYPCLYKVYEEKEENKNKIQEMANNLNRIYGKSAYQNLSKSMLGVYPNSWYDMEGSHEGLGLEHYCNCTDELRRGADIVVEHALEVCYDKKPSTKELQELEKEIEKKKNEINAKQHPIDWFVKDYKSTYQKRRN